MAVYPEHGSGNWDLPLKAYIDELVTVGFLDPKVAALVLDEDSDTYAALLTLLTITPDSPFFYPETYGAVGDGIANDSGAVQEAMDEASAYGGGLAVFKARYGCTGDIVQRGGVTVWGTAVNKVLVVEGDTGRGLVALDSTFRYFYGKWASANSQDDNPGGLYNLVIDGDNVGGATAGLFIAQCVDGYALNNRVIKSAGNGMLFDGTQNSTFTGGYSGLHAGRAFDFSRISDNGQGAGSVKINDYYGGTSGQMIYASSDDSNYWPHDIFFNNGIFENYDEGLGMIHLRAGDFHFDKCVITNSNDGSPAPLNDCLVLVEQNIWPTIPTFATFTNCYFNGSVGLDHIIRVKTVTGSGQVGNHVRLYGKTYVIGADYLIALDGGGAFTSTVTVDGDVFRTGGGGLTSPDWYVALNGAWMHNVQRRTAMPVRWEMPTDSGGFLPDPISMKRVGDAYDRHRTSRDGTHFWGSGNDATIGGGLIAYDIVNDRMQLGGSWQVTNALELRGLISATVSAPGTAVALTAAKTGAPYQLIYFSTTGATANVTISGGHVGSVMLVGIQGTGLNSISWSADFRFKGSPPQPRNGVIDYVLLKQELDGDWHEISRSQPPINQIRENRLATGQETMPRETVDQNIAPVSGLLTLTEFTAYKTETVTQVRTFTGNTAAGATPTLCKVGIYSVAANGDHTLIASTANTTTLWAAVNTAYTTALTGSVTLYEGQRYAMAWLIVTAAALPLWPCQGLAVAMGSELPRIAGQIAGQTDLPASFVAGAIANASVRRFGELLP